MPGQAPLLHLVLPRWAGFGLHRVFGHRMPPMALLVLSALARRRGWRTQVIDENYERLPTERPDAVAMTVWTMLAPRAYELADRFRADGIPVILGGVHPSMLPGEALRHADAVVVGEAESVIAEVLDDLLGGRLRDVYHGSWNGMHEVPRAEEWADIVASWPITRYIPMNTLQTTRGCRFNCDFCSVIRVNGRGSRHREPDEVVEDLRTIDRVGQRVGGFNYTFLLDDDLAADLEFAGNLCEAIASSGLKLTWGAQASIGLAKDPVLLALAARSGCGVLFTGFESISRDTLIECNKKNRPNEFQESVRQLHQHGILIEGGFIFGFDHDDESVFDDTVEFVDNIGVDAAHFSVLTPYPGTHTFARMAEDDRIRQYDWSLYDLYHVTFDPARMSAETLEAGLWRAYRNFYSRSRRWRRLRRQVAGRVTPQVTGALTVNNADYARRYRGPVRRPSTFQPDPSDLQQLLRTSRAPAQEAITVAVDQLSVRTRRAPVTAGS